MQTKHGQTAKQHRKKEINSFNPSFSMKVKS